MCNAFLIASRCAPFFHQLVVPLTGGLLLLHPILPKGGGGKLIYPNQCVSEVCGVSVCACVCACVCVCVSSSDIMLCECVCECVCVCVCVCVCGAQRHFVVCVCVCVCV